MRDLTHQLQSIRTRPTSLLTDECVLALGAFLEGYRHVNRGSTDVLDRLRAGFPGPNEADVWTRAYLTSESSRVALHRVLDALDELLGNGEPAPIPGPYARQTFVDVVRKHIADGRPALVLGNETTVLSLRGELD